MRALVWAATLVVAWGCGDVEPGDPAIAEGAEVAFPDEGGPVFAGQYRAVDDVLAVSYSFAGGHAVAEGDILLDPRLLRPEADGERALTAVSHASRLWADGVIPFTIRADLTHPDRVARATAHWEERTGLRFVPRTDEADYVEFCPGTGCGSHVGRIGGRQALYVGDGCSTGSLIHELGHAAGLWHEQSRPDRDRYVQVLWDNVEPGHAHNFERLGSSAQELGPYDFDSVMHYGPYIFSRNGEPTLVVRGGDEPVPSHRLELSDGDVRGVARLYGFANPD